MADEKTAWGYVRISQESDASLEEQKESIRDYARERGLALQTTRNEGTRTSGFNADREEYQRLVEQIGSASIDAVITRDRARMSRDFDERLRLIQLFRETGVEWHVVEANAPLGLTDVQTAGVECIQGAMDHVKKMVEIERSKKAIQKRTERGCYQGKIPFGLRYADDNCHLERDPSDWETLTAIVTGDMDGTVAEVSDRAGVSTATVSRARNRGLEWYEEMLAEYGT